MSAPAPPAVVPKKKRRWRWVLLVLFVVLLAGGWLAPGLLAKSAYKDTLVADLTADVNGRVTVGEVSLNWLHPVEAFDLSVTDANGRPVLSAKKVSTSKTLLELLLHRADLGTVRVEHPRAEVAFESGTTNVQRAFAKYLEPTAAKTTRPAVNVELVDGVVRLADGKEATELTAVGGTASIPAGDQPITFDLNATAGGAVKAEGEIGTGGKVTLTATDFDLAALGPAVRHVAPDVGVGGRLRSQLTATWTPREKGLPAFSADGEVHLADVKLAAKQLGERPVHLAAADMPVSVTFDGQALKVAKLSLACDFGTVGFVGEYDTAASPEAFLNQTGLTFDADIDLARLGNAAPGLLRLKPGTELTRGRITAKVTSAKGDKGTTWGGSVATSNIEGKQEGRVVKWEQPLSATFAGRVRADGLPAFDKLVVQSDFIGAQARGEPESFDAVANIDLTKLGSHLGELLDLNGLKLQGYAKEWSVRVRPKDGGGLTLTAGGTVQNLSVSDRTGVLVADPNLTLSASAEGKITNGAVRVDSGQLSVKAGTDTLDVTLTEPLADAKAAAVEFAKSFTLPTAKGTVSLRGDLNRWRGRVGSLVHWPSDWAIGGTATELSGRITLGKTVVAEQVKLAVTNAHFRGLGLAIDEPALNVNMVPPNGRITLDPTTGAVMFADTTVSSQTVSGAVAKLDLVPNEKGEYGMTGKANVVAKLDRVQKTLQMQSAKDLSDQFRGTATGPVAVSAPTFDAMTFTVDLSVDRFEFGPPAKPTWGEPTMKVRGGVGYRFSTDTLTLTNAVVERDGLTVSGSGTIARLGTEANLDVSGTLGYDLAKVEPVLKQYLGKSAAASGKDTRPFKATGAVLSGQPAAVDLGKVSGTAGLSWTSLRAYGFDVGKGDLTVTADRGRATTTPIHATFGGGTVTAEPVLRLTPGTFDVAFKPGRVVEKAKLTPAVCAEAIGYALPAIANAAQADGLVSFDLAESGFPLADPTAGHFKGTLTIHEGSVSPTPVVTQILEVLDIKSPSVQLSKGSAVPLAMKNGRVSHSNFTFLVGNTPVSTSGSVGVDGSLELTLTVPVGGTIAEKLLPNQPALQKAVANQHIGVKVKGTLAKPQLDADGMRGQLQAVLRGAAKDVAQEKGKELVDDALKKGLDQLFKKK